MAAGHAFAWTGLSGAAWNAASSWSDRTLGGAASVAPGSLDSVSIVGAASPLVVTGSGAAAVVGSHGSVLLDGAFQFASLDVDGTLTLAGAGSRLALGGLGQAASAVASTIVLDAGSLTVAAGTVMGSATVTGGGFARLGLTAAVSAGIAVDDGSCAEVGSGGTFWPSWLKVYADGTFSGSGAIAANTVVTGTILSSGLRFGGFLGGTGQVRLDASGATVGTVFAGTRIVFAAPGASLSVTSAAAMAGTLVGFGAGNAIDLLGEPVASAHFTAIDAQDGVLSVAGPGGATLGQFLLAGSAASYAAASFTVLPDGAGGSLLLETGAASVLTHPS